MVALQGHAVLCKFALATTQKHSTVIFTLDMSDILCSPSLCLLVRSIDNISLLTSNILTFNFVCFFLFFNEVIHLFVC